jgi:hypothetical protein
VHGRTPVLVGALAAALLCAPTAQAVVVSDCANLSGALALSDTTVTLQEGLVCNDNYAITGANLTIEGAGTGASLRTTTGGRALVGTHPGTTVLRNLDISSNDGLRGGVQLSGNGSLLVEGSTFTRNGGVATGGGLRAQLSGAITVTGSVFGGSGVGNSAVDAGGGAYLQTTSGATITVTSTTFSSNRTTDTDGGVGAGLYIENPATSCSTATPSPRTPKVPRPARGARERRSSGCRPPSRAPRSPATRSFRPTTRTRPRAWDWS